MSFSRRKKWEDMPSSGDLAKLMGCEREFVLERETGVESSDPTRRARAKAGQAAHLHAQEQMEAFHNKGAQDSRCVVASAVYGHDAPETDELRDFRDQSLLPTAAGRAVVKGTTGSLRRLRSSWRATHELLRRYARSSMDSAGRCPRRTPTPRAGIQAKIFSMRAQAT